MGDWIGLAATSLVAAFLQAANGFGFAVLAVPFFLVFTAPGQAVQLTILLTLSMSVVVLPGLGRSIDAPLLRRLTLGSLIGLPLGLAVFGYADPVLVRGVAGATIAIFAGVLAFGEWRARHGAERAPLIAMRPGRDLAAGIVSGAATALVGMSGPPTLIYMMLAGAPPRVVRATLLAFFALSYAATLAAHLATLGVPAATWRAAAILLPFTWAGALLGRRVGDRLGRRPAAVLAIAVLAVAGLYTVGAALWFTLS